MLSTRLYSYSAEGPGLNYKQPDSRSLALCTPLSPESIQHSDLSFLPKKSNECQTISFLKSLFDHGFLESDPGSSAGHAAPASSSLAPV